MALTATINSKTKDGAAIELIVEKSGDDTAKLTAKNWTLNKPPPSAASKVSETKLYTAKVSADLNTIMCKAEAFGPDPDVTLVLAEAAKTVTITIKGSLGGMGDGVETYALADTDLVTIKKFIADAKYPSA